ncbi:hypothetical protein F0L68_09395 [Solihabitans fulvus]|uniref:Uncharacterized protein n=1 Tax=Solihabitans fulvus TaxID=1892852 RepID=A0A5B2XK75_9PSEU|nr:hypothetical protein [Solihabitans fulvus]KAA2263696.1 hypothetical protein F0L68_09395 [Solihabitans fulvus]
MAGERGELRPALASATTLARATGSCLIVYSYLWGLWPDRHATRFPPVDLVREWVNRPLGIGEDFGMLGVMLLLLASGFSAVSGTAAPREVLGRLVRIYLPLLVVAPVAAGLFRLGADILINPPDGHPGSLAAVRELSLVSQAVPGSVPLVTLGWVIGLELLAGLTGAAIIRLPAAALAVPATQLLAVAGVLLLGGPPPQLALALTLFPMAVLGQLLGCRSRQWLPGWAVAAFGIVVWVLLAGSDRTHPQLHNWWYPLAACYATLFFLLTLRVAGPLSAHPVTSWLASRSRWLLVLVGVVGWTTLGLARHALPFAPAAAVATLVTLLAAEVGHRGATLLTERLPAPRSSVDSSGIPSTDGSLDESNSAHDPSRNQPSALRTDR